MNQMVIFLVNTQDIQFVPSEKRLVSLNNEEVSLLPYIFQTKVTPTSPVVHLSPKPYWIVLGGETNI